MMAALFGNASVGFASCSHQATGQHPSHCVNGFVCSKSLQGNRKFIREAKRRGLSCEIKTVKPIVLQTHFKKLSVDKRKQLQSNLKDLDFYKSSIDGLYGKGTAGALTAYNKQNLDGADLRKSANVETLIKTVLALKIKLEEAPVPTPKFETITETESQPATSTEAEPKKKRDLEKEFGLSLYGSFLHSEKIPNALFFFDDIEQNDSFEFRKAILNHDVDLIVLSSPGGSVFEGLQIAGIIHDKGLHTYIPKNGLEENGDCASACSFMFFAGATRSAEGNLGVHQFMYGDKSKKEKREVVAKEAQFTVSEIIGFLNEFNTPSWVFERMFQDQKMYYFKEKELALLETEIPDSRKANYADTEIFISELNTAFEQMPNDEDPVSRADFIKRVQEKLNEIGCNAGFPDGLIGPKTATAIMRFERKANVSLENDPEEFFETLADAPSGFCQ